MLCNVHGAWYHQFHHGHRPIFTELLFLCYLAVPMSGRGRHNLEKLDLDLYNGKNYIYLPSHAVIRERIWYH